MIPYGRPPPLQRLQVRVGVAARDLQALPRDLEALGRRLVDRVESALERGRPAPLAIALAGDSAWTFPILPLVRQGADLHQFLAAVAGREGVEALAVVGVAFARRGRGRPAAARLVFVEARDGRWWTSFRPLEVEGEGIERSAEAGDPLPGGLGGWFSRARREGLRVRFEPAAGSPVVH